MTKLHSILAVEKTAKSEAEKALTTGYHNLQKDTQFGGISRTYQPRDDDGDTLPSESTNVQVSVVDVLDSVKDGMTRLFDVTLTKDHGNTLAEADLVVEGSTLLMGVPATYLLFLEKKLLDIKTFVTKIPVLDPAVNWSEDVSQGEGVWVSDEVKTTKTKKIPRNHVKAEATERHPAQVEVYFEDVIVGDWTTKKFSGAATAAQKAELLRRVNTLSDAVKVAREVANSTDVPERTAGAEILNYLLG